MQINSQPPNGRKLAWGSRILILKAEEAGDLKNLNAFWVNQSITFIVSEY